MLLSLLLELAYKSLALAVTVWVAHYLTTSYLEALVEFTRVYITVVDILYEEGRVPFRI